MDRINKFFNKTVIAVLLSAFLVPAVYGLETGGKPIAEEVIGSGGISWSPRINYSQLDLTVSRPDGTVFQKTFESGASPYAGLSEITGESGGDGSYNYELRLIPVVERKYRGSDDDSLLSGTRGRENLPRKALTQAGAFLVRDGSIVTSGPPEEISRTKDVLHYDDVIITGSLCVGYDCQDGESFGYDIIKLKDYQLRIYFNDISYTSSYPTNDWRITVNDSYNGGADYFSIDDVDEGTSIFKIEAGAPSNSLYVEDYGRIGLGTSTPVVELHIKDSDTPTVRLDQDSSGGWTPQIWDVAGNEINFFIRDVTSGWKLPFRIQAGTPTSTLCLKSDGKVGIGTWSPGYPLEVQTTGMGAQMVAERTDGATMEFSASGSYGIAGTKTNHPVRLRVNDIMIMQLNGSGDYIEMIGGGTYDGTWNPSSSREVKENIHNLAADEAMKALQELNPVKFNYKANKKQDRVGFIAEDVPELVALNGRKSLGTVDIVAVLTKVVQEQQKTIAELKTEIAELKKK